MGAGISTTLKPVHDSLYFVLPIAFWAYALYKSYDIMCVKQNAGLATMMLLALIIFATLDVVYCIGLVTDKSLTSDTNFQVIKFNIYAEIVIFSLGILLATFDLFKTVNKTKCESVTAAYGKVSAAYSRVRRR